jgi:hypothetical protein
MLEGDDIMAWNFYMTEATPFVRDFGLMNGRIAEIPFEGVAKSIFVKKLSAVHNAVMEHAASMAKEETGEKPEVVIEGSENG